MTGSTVKEKKAGEGSAGGGDYSDGESSGYLGVVVTLRDSF